MNFGLVPLLVAIVCLAQACSSFVALSNTVPSRSAVGSSIQRPSRHEHEISTTFQAAIPRIATSKILRRAHHRPQEHEEISVTSTRRRRDFLRDAIASASLLFGRSVANAAMKSDQTVFEAGKDLTLDEAKARFKEGQVSLDYLLANYDEICAGGGDNVRRYLGTVGTTSGLYGISKVMKTMQEDAEDIVEFTETMNEINSALVGADGSAYMAIFTGTSTSGVPEEKYYADAKIEIKRAIASMQELAKQMKIQ